jgi:hypothetical protein
LSTNRYEQLEYGLSTAFQFRLGDEWFS